MIKSILLKVLVPGYICINFLLAECQGETSSACYGTDPTCDFYSMQCPSSQVIRLYNLYAGYKSEPVCGTNSKNHCSYSSLCCSYKSGDVLELFKLENIYYTYMNCSGRQFCQNVETQWQLLPNLVTSTYAQIEYGCETVSSKIQFCGGATGSVTGIYNTAEIIFDGSVDNFDPAKATKDCQCTVENIGIIQQYIVFTTIDVRLESFYKSENQNVATCSSATLSISKVLYLQCEETSHHYDVNFYYNRQGTLRLHATETTEIYLANIHKDSPAMVWISLQAEVNRNIRVTCEELISGTIATATSLVQTTSTTGSISSNLTNSSETAVTLTTTTSVFKNNSKSISSITESTKSIPTNTSEATLPTTVARITTSVITFKTEPTPTTSSESTLLLTSLTATKTTNPIATTTSMSTTQASQNISYQADNSSLFAVQAGIVVGTALLSSLITAGIIFFVIRFRRQNKKRKQGQTTNYSEPCAYENFAEVSNAEVSNQQNGNVQVVQDHIVGNYQELIERSQNFNQEVSAAYDQLHVGQGVYLELSGRSPSENQYSDIIQQ